MSVFDLGGLAAALASCFGRWRLAGLPFQPVTLHGARKSQDRLAPKTPNFCFFWDKNLLCPSFRINFLVLFLSRKNHAFFPLQVVGSSNSKRFEVWVWVWWGQAGSVANGGWMIQKYTNTGETMLSFVCYIYYQKNVKQTLWVSFFWHAPGKKNIPPPKKKLPIWRFSLSTADSPTRWPLLRKKAQKTPNIDRARSQKIKQQTGACENFNAKRRPKTVWKNAYL